MNGYAIDGFGIFALPDVNGTSPMDLMNAEDTLTPPENTISVLTVRSFHA